MTLGAAGIMDHDSADSLDERVHELLATNAVAFVVGWEDRACVVNGRTGWWTVRAYSDRVECSCPAGEMGTLCSHAAAAMVIWNERCQ